MSVVRATLLCCGLGLALPLTVTAAAASPPVAIQPAHLQVGAQLVAIRTVSLRQATLQKGSRVRVVAVARTGARPVAVDLELADGHVLRKVAYRKVVSSFRLLPPARR